MNTTKIWYGLGTIAALGVAAPDLSHAAGAESATVQTAENFPGDFTGALAKIFAGEGGEGGDGLTTMWPRISAPALTGEQIKQAVTGNSLSIPHHYALNFADGDALGGYEVELNKIPEKSCPAPEVVGDLFLKHGDTCFSRKVNPWAGTWKVQGNQLCVDLKWQAKSFKDCWHVVILLDRIALFNPSGALHGKGNTLHKGKHGDE
ncbi:hypothetical protein [Steroidobacter sp.]|uniref:hypothetical protein n=1 Tax=Steroidobacter sp. TaxID=1978227 RepID=UPI001A4CE59D|nr:hypothetical protein [Steroidobacter sp.]MBL8266347.1 hypothetical protein [Steroidobacter sp.]